MAMPEVAPSHWTADMVRALPDDGKRYEVIAGELFVTPAPRWLHQELVVRLLVLLRVYLERWPRLASALASPADISWDDDTLVQPDLFVVPASEVSASWRTAQTLLLAIEVLSPSSARADRVRKRQLYQRVGVREYWIVDAESRVVEVWRPGEDRPAIVTDRLAWFASGVAEPCTVELDALFSGLPE